MNFVQTMTIETQDVEPVRALMADWHATQVGIAPGYLQSRLLADRDRPGRYLILVDFSSAEGAAQNNERPETAEWAAKLSALISGDAVFEQYDER